MGLAFWVFLKEHLSNISSASNYTPLAAATTTAAAATTTTTATTTQRKRMKQNKNKRESERTKGTTQIGFPWLSAVLMPQAWHPGVAFNEISGLHLEQLGRFSRVCSRRSLGCHKELRVLPWPRSIMGQSQEEERV